MSLSHPTTTIEQLDDGFGGILQSHGHSSGGGLAAHQPTSHAPPMIDDVLASYDPYGTNVYKGTPRIYISPLHLASQLTSTSHLTSFRLCYAMIS